MQINVLNVDDKVVRVADDTFLMRADGVVLQCVERTTAGCGLWQHTTYSHTDIQQLYDADHQFDDYVLPTVGLMMVLGAILITYITWDVTRRMHTMEMNRRKSCGMVIK
jgi:hypothetical protein